MPGDDGFLLRLDLRALWHHERATGMETAARRGIDRRGDFAGQNDLLSHDVRVGGKGGREESLGAGMRRILEQLLRLGPFYYLAQVHDRDLMGHVAGRRQMV